MKTIIITLAALGALSTAALAERTRNYELRDIQPFQGGASVDQAYGEAAGFEVLNDDGVVSNFDRLNANSAKNESSSH